MGIDGLYKFINKNIPHVYKTISIYEIKGQSCIIDGMQHIYSQLIYMRSKNKEVQTESGNNISHIHGLINSLIYYLKNGVIPIFIFDGKAPDIKKKKIEERRKNLKENLKKLKTLEEEENKLMELIKDKISNSEITNLNIENIPEFEDEVLILEPTIESELITEKSDINEQNQNNFNNIDFNSLEEEIKKICIIKNEKKKLYKKSIILKDYYIKDWIMILDFLGLPVVKAKEEADPLCAHILKNNKNITGIISDDSDMIIFGAPVLMRKSQNKQFNIIEQYILLNAFEKLLEKIFGHKIIFNFDNLVDFALLLGTDYGTFKFNKNLSDPMDILKYYIESDKDINKIISSDQMVNFINIKKYYTEFTLDNNLSFLLEKPSWTKPKLLELKQKLLELDVDEDYIDKNCQIINNYWTKYNKKNNKNNFFLNFIRKKN